MQCGRNEARKSDLVDVTPLHIAVEKNQSDVACLLLKGGLAAPSLHEGGRRWASEFFNTASSRAASSPDYDYDYGWEKRDRDERQRKLLEKEDHTFLFV